MALTVAGLVLTACGHSGAPPVGQPASTTTAPPATAATPTTRDAAPLPVTGLSATRPCGALTAAPVYRHVIWIWMENLSYDTVIGSPQAPYINGLATRCGLATNYHNISHPSLPNYIGAVTGLGVDGLAQFGSDCSPSVRCNSSAPSIFGQGEAWKAYEESMSNTCASSDAGEYAVRHNPPVYLASLTGCDGADVPYSQLATDLASNALPAFSFVTPNLVDDMHDGTVAGGDGWLARNLPVIFASAEYRDASTAVFVTWDEGEGGSSRDCAANPADVGCHVATIVVSPSTPGGTRSATLFNHYSLLGTAEQLLGLPKLGLASAYPTMTAPFHL